MKLKGHDGVTREFTTSYNDSVSGWMESVCVDCGYGFGVHDTRVLKPLWLAHVCRPEDLRARRVKRGELHA